MPDELPQASPPLPLGRFEGRLAFQQLVRDALQKAADEGWREIILADADFADWPLGERAVDASLRAWSRTGRSMILLAKSYAVVQATHHRFVRWRGDWSHIVQAHACASVDPVDFPSAIWSPQWIARRIDPEHCVGVADIDPVRRTALHEQLQEMLGQSRPAFPAVTLGL